MLFSMRQKLFVQCAQSRYVSNTPRIYDKMHFKLEKSLQNMSEIFDMVHMSQVVNLAEVSRDFRDIILRAKQMARNPKSCTQMLTMHVC